MDYVKRCNHYIKKIAEFQKNIEGYTYVNLYLDIHTHTKNSTQDVDRRYDITKSLGNVKGLFLLT